MNRITEPEKIPTNNFISNTPNKTVKDVLMSIHPLNFFN